LNIDRVVILNKDEAVIVYEDRSPVRLYAAGDITNFVSWFLSPRVVIRLDEYRRAVALSNEDTSEIEVA
jgi:hypothetical protein